MGNSVKKNLKAIAALETAEFGYTEDTVIDDISFTIPQGTTTALVGASGSIAKGNRLCNDIGGFVLGLPEG